MSFVFLLDIFLLTIYSFIMGRGDKKTLRGKIAMGTFGKKRPRKTSPSVTVVAEAPKAKKKVSEPVEKPVAEEKKKVTRKAKPKES